MSRVRLLDDRGNTEHEFDVPTAYDRELGGAGDLTFRGRSYRYTTLSKGVFVFEPSGPTFALKDDWLMESVE